MCYNWTVDGDGGGISNPRLDILIENALMLARTSKKYFVFALVQRILIFLVENLLKLLKLCGIFSRLYLKLYLTLATNRKCTSIFYFSAGAGAHYQIVQ